MTHLDDREPYDFSAEDGTFAWFKGVKAPDDYETEQERRATINPLVFDALSGCHPWRHEGSTVKHYPTRESAVDALVLALADGEVLPAAYIEIEG
jgi:hypothetical protein